MRSILVLVLSYDEEPWRSIEATQRATWATSTDLVHILYLQGEKRGPLRFLFRLVAYGLKKLSLPIFQSWFQHKMGAWFSKRDTKTKGDCLLVGVPETYLNTNAKMIAGFRHVLKNYNFEYLLRTNSSTYISMTNLSKYVDSLPRTRFYGGYLGSHNGVKYASGTCALLTRDMVEFAAWDPQWDFNIIDDVALGKSMARAGVQAEGFRRIDVSSENQIDELILEDIDSVFVFRCKGRDQNGRNDSAIMLKIHKLYGSGI